MATRAFGPQPLAWGDEAEMGGAVVIAVLGLSFATILSLLRKYGYIAVFVLVAGESMGLPLPGETIVETAGIYAGSTHHMSFLLIWMVAAAAAIIGDNLGYMIGRLGGFRVARRYGRYVRLDETKLKIGKYIFDRQGGKVVFFGRFVVVLRTYVAFLAGTTVMPWRRFFFFNASSGIAWSGFYSFATYELGAVITKLAAPFDYALGSVAIIVMIVVGIALKRKSAEYAVLAEAAYPGPLDNHFVHRGHPNHPASRRAVEAGAEF